ncbi:MAG: hypothetical protein S4CHLAM45_15330 [Chlamydiales bacterium]|nr:hypothetical protein [Chlamydiales bacterium]MCH9620150.1 hypothetical protein [Chlamydiales bacterium]MCH9623620.1 hypothetical protein [Chlamydiales bacterium]
MEKAIRLVFNLHPGEGVKSLLFILLGFLWSIGTYGMFTLSEGMFLEHIGADKLPYTYIFVSLSLCLLSGILIFSLNHLSIRKILFLLISIWSTVTLGFYFCRGFSSHAEYWYLLKVFGWVMPISTYICYWSFIDQYMDLQSGKRLFCLINSVTFLGDACGGGIISMGIGQLGHSGILLIFGLIMTGSLPFIYLISRKLSPIIDEHADHLDTRSSLSFKEIIRKVASSKFTLYLLGFYFIMQLLVIVTEFSYMKTFGLAFKHRSEHDLTQFLGTCNMWIALSNVLFGAIVYSRIVKKMGVNNVILMAPAFFLLLFSFWFWKKGISIALFGLIAREGITYTFDDNNLNLLISGVPTKIKNQIRITVESFFEPFGMLISALLLLFLHDYSHILGLSVALAALSIAFLLRSHYSKALFSNLIASSIRFGKRAIDWIPKKDKKQFEHHLLTTLKHSDESSRLLGFEYLLRLKDLNHLPRLLNTVNLMTLPGKLIAIDLLSNSSVAKETVVIERLERWRRTIPHSSLQGAIHLYFAKHALLLPEKIMQNLHSDELTMRAAAILSMRTKPSLPTLVTLASEKLRTLLDSKIEREICIGIEILENEGSKENLKHLLPYLKHASKQVNRSAAKAIAQIATEEEKKYAPLLIHHLTYGRDHKTRLHCLLALEKMNDKESAAKLILATVHFRPGERSIVERILFKMGRDMDPMLLTLVQDRFIHERCRLLAGKILARNDPALLNNHLFSLLKIEIDRAYFYFYHCDMVRNQSHDQDLSILGDALESGYHSVVDFIIQLIGAASSLEQSEVLSHSLRSRNSKIRAQASETLQKTCGTRLFSLIEPLIDESAPQQKLRTYLKRGHIPLNLTQLLDAMVHSPSLTDQIIAIGLKEKLGVPDWREILTKKLKGNEEIFHHFAHELLEGVS